MRNSLPTTEVGASGIAFCGSPGPVLHRKSWQTLDATRDATAFGGGKSDVVICG